MSNYTHNLALYDALVDRKPDIQRKGKANPYTSLNGHMFSFFDKEATLGLRLSKVDKEAFEEKYNSPPFIQHNSIMNGYVTVPQELLEDTDKLFPYFEQSIAFAGSLKPKPTKKKK